jgi:DNA-binding NtrC family response regulator
VESRDLRSTERELIEAILSETGGNRREAARRLGISERTLYRRLRQYQEANGDTA